MGGVEGLAYGTTYEPITFVYNKRLVPEGDVPKDHAELLELLNAKTDFYKGRITAYDPERSGVGYLFCNADIKDFPQAWDLFKAMGKAQAKLYTSAGTMMERVTSGEHLIGYGIFGSYALGRSKKDPNLGIILPKDYTMVTSRVAFISKPPKIRMPASSSSTTSCRSAARTSSQTRLISIRFDRTLMARRRSEA